MGKNFVHLHVHSEYSLLDGLLKIDDLIRKAIEFEMPAVALTDHGNMYGVIDFYKSAKKSGIKPIVGCEVYQAPKNRFEKKTNRDKGEDLYNHLTLLVKDKDGYKNLMKLVSLGFLEGFYYKPRIDADLLKEYSKGLIALSGCLSGRIPRAVETGKINDAKKYIQEYIEIFGRENFYIELTDFNIARHKNINRTLFDLAEQHKIKTVCTNDVHYLNPEDYKYHFVLLCIQAGITIGDFRKYCIDADADSELGDTIRNIINKLAEQESDKKNIEMEKSEKSGFFPRTMEYYFKNCNQMSSLFKDFPGAIENTSEIAERCNLELDFNLGLIPPFEVPEGFTPDDYLKKLCFDSIKEKYPHYSDSPDAIEARINKELGVIRKMGFAEYFLIVWDFVHFAKSNSIRVGPGRGSAAGSIISYLLNITDIEPLKYNLLFERFLNEERRKMPDIDIDFCDEHRDKVIKYVTEKYGENRVAQLITFGTMAARQAIRDAGRVLEVSYAEVDKIAKLVPMELNMTIDNALEMVMELKESYNNNKKVREIINVAKSLEGKARQHSLHAAGVVISADDLFNYTPIQRDDKSGDIKTQYKMEDVQEIGLLKMDFLGLKTLSLIDRTIFLIKKTKNIDIEINSIDLEDKKTYKMLADGDCLGVFQLESSGMRELVLNLKPGKFEDIIATLALFRPGPLQSGMVSDFVQSKNRNKKISYLHPSLEPILKETYGIILYQEQIMLIVSKLAGFSMSEADILRDAISKKKRDVMTRQKNKFISGTKKMGIVDEQTANRLFELITHFAEYGFNKSHSTAYAMISYQTAYLKANYPVEFIAALLSVRMGSQEKVAQYISEARRMNIEVLPPDINESYADFTVIGNSIRFGLSAIKNVGSNVIEQITEERKANGKFKDFDDFCKRVPSGVLNKKTLESLIKSGVFDTLGYTRKYLMENFETITDKANKLKRSEQSGQFSLFDESVEKGINNGIVEGIEINCSTGYPDTGNPCDEYSPKELLHFEKEMLGLYISGHPLDEYGEVLKGYKSIDTLIDERDKSTQVIAGVIMDLKEILTKSNAKMYFLTLEDLTDSIEVIVFPTVREKYDEFLKTGSVVTIKGKIDKKENREDRETDDRREVQIKFIAMELSRVKKEKAGPDREDAVFSNGISGKINEGVKKGKDAPSPGKDKSTDNDNFVNNGNDSAENSIDGGIISEGFGIKETFEAADISGLTISGQSGSQSSKGGSYKIILQIKMENFNRQLVDSLHNMLVLNKGNVPVVIKVINGDELEPVREYSMPSEFCISLSEKFYKDLKYNFKDKINWETIPDIY